MGANLAGLIAVVSREAAAGIVHRAGGHRGSADFLHRVRHECESGGGGLVHHPFERLIGRRVVRIAATDVRVHAGEPYLTDPLRIFRP